MACKILISTTVDWVSTARHAAGFALAGCTVEAVAPRASPIRLSRHVSRSYSYNALSPAASLRRAILHSQPDLIVNGDDRAVETLLQLYRAEPINAPIAMLIARSLGRPDRYADVMSRENSLAAAHRLGIRVPRTLAVPSEPALDGALSAIGLPAVLKVDGSWGGEGVAVVKSKAEAAAAYRRLATVPSFARRLARFAKRRDLHWLRPAQASEPRPITIQAFIAGHPAASGFAAWDGDVAAMISYDMLKTDGVTGPPRVVRRVDCQQIAEATRLLAKHFGLSGLHGLDFIRDREGQVHLLEINPRATQGGTLSFGPRRDLAAALASRISSATISRPAIANDTVVFFPGEWVREPASAWFAMAHHDVPWDDPKVMRRALKGANPPAPPQDKPVSKPPFPAVQARAASLAEVSA